VYVHVDTSDVDAELDRLADGPDTRTVLALEAVLTAQFAATQAAVHIRTGSLKTSGNPESDRDRHTWTGEIRYGGEAEGAIKNPVLYAEFEQRRGDTHDFLAPAEALESAYGAVMLAFLRGDL